MNKLIQQFRQYIKAESLFEPKDRLLVGVSGGLDSVVLCHLLKACAFDFEIAHLNFGLRGYESERDKMFVANLADGLQVPVHFMEAPTAQYTVDHKVSIQVAARDLRYQWFEKLLVASKASDRPLQYILTAHHANDNAETILMNFFRGTGLSGLQGIPPLRDLIRRPLLFASREMLKNYAAETGLAWVEDSSNATDKYTRNFVRNRLIPQIEIKYPALVNNLNESARHARETNAFLENAVRDLLRRIVTVKGQDQMVPVKRLLQVPGKTTVLFYWIKDFGFGPAQLNDAMSLGFSQSGHYIDSASHRLIRNRDWLVITPLESKSSGLILLEGEAGAIGFPGGHLAWCVKELQMQHIPSDADSAFLDADKIIFPILLRTWKTGDYFYPLGMQKKKKLARFFIDAKLSRIAKDKIWVLESAGRIIWVIGQRIDDRFKVKPATRKLLQVSLTSAER